MGAPVSQHPFKKRMLRLLRNVQVILSLLPVPIGVAHRDQALRAHSEALQAAWRASRGGGG